MWDSIRGNRHASELFTRHRKHLLHHQKNNYQFKDLLPLDYETVHYFTRPLTYLWLGHITYRTYPKTYFKKWITYHPSLESKICCPITSFDICNRWYWLGVNILDNLYHCSPIHWLVVNVTLTTSQCSLFAVIQTASSRRIEAWKHWFIQRIDA